MANMYDRLIDKVKDKGNASVEGEMSFFQHLEALRWHVVRAALAILVFAIVAFIYYDKIFDNILNMRRPWDDINIGEGEDCLSVKAADLIKKLLEPDPKKRLKVEQIKKHEFFAGCLDYLKIEEI